VLNVLASDKYLHFQMEPGSGHLANAGGGGSRFSGLKFQQQVTATASPFDYVKAGAAVSSKANLFLYIPDNPFN